MSETENRKMSQINAINAVENSVCNALIASQLGFGVRFVTDNVTKDDVAAMYKVAITMIIACIGHYNMSDADIKSMFNGARAAERTMYQ